jgi:hypothetical protein
MIKKRCVMCGGETMVGYVYYLSNGIVKLGLNPRLDDDWLASPTLFGHPGRIFHFVKSMPIWPLFNVKPIFLRTLLMTRRACKCISTKRVVS